MRRLYPGVENARLTSLWLSVLRTRNSKNNTGFRPQDGWREASLRRVFSTHGTQRHKSEEPRTMNEANLPVEAEPQRTISVSYADTAEISRRGSRYFLLHTKFNIALITLAGIDLGLHFSLPIFMYNSLLGWIAFPLLSLLGAGIFIAIATRLIGFVTTIQRIITKSVYTYKFSLLSEGVQSAFPKKTRLASWVNISNIKEHEGDIHFWKDRKYYKFIPREAFKDREEALEFYLAAVTLWKSKGQIWPDELLT